MVDNTKVTDPVLDSDAVVDSLSGASIPQVSVVPTDKVLIQDTDDSDNLKWVEASELAAGATGTNLSNTPDADSVLVESSTGTDTDIAAATGLLAGVMSAADKDKLDNIEANADVTDETNVKSSLDGATIPTATVAGTDKVLIQDTDDTDNLKTVTAQDIADLSAGSGPTNLGNTPDADSVLITSSTGTDTDVLAATGVAAGVMSAADKTKLDNIDTEVETLSLPASTTISTFGASLVDDADAATARGTLGVDPAGTDNSTNVTLGGVPSDTTDDTLNLTGQELTVNLATTTTDGAMSGADKLKLDGIADGAEVNVNADWNAVSGDAQILNKPTDITDLSTHNVTELSDVSDAGSGQIITSGERTLLGTAEQTANKGVANGYAELDGSGLVPVSQLPSSVTGGIRVIGSWNANTNTPDLSALTLNQGEAYIVSVAGSTSLNGETNWKAKDLVVWDDALAGNYFKLDNTDDVISVNSQTGVVSLTTDNIPDFTNKRYVTDTDLTNLSNLSGTNTGDQTITLTGDVTGSGTGSFAATISNDSVTLAKMQNAIANDKLLGSGDAGAGNDYVEITLGSGLTMTGTTLSVDAGAVVTRDSEIIVLYDPARAGETSKGVYDTLAGAISAINTAKADYAARGRILVDTDSLVAITTESNLNFDGIIVEGVFQPTLGEYAHLHFGVNGAIDPNTNFVQFHNIHIEGQVASGGVWALQDATTTIVHVTGEGEVDCSGAGGLWTAGGTTSAIDLVIMDSCKLLATSSAPLDVGNLGTSTLTLRDRAVLDQTNSVTVATADTNAIDLVVETLFDGYVDATFSGGIAGLNSVTHPVKLNSDEIDNNSGVVGANVSAALDQLDTDIAALGVFGTEYGFAESAGDTTNGTQTPASKVQYTIPSGAPTGVYHASYDCLISSTTAGRQYVLDFEANSVLQRGSPVEDIGSTDDDVNANRTFRISHTNGVATVLDLLFYRGTQATTITISQAVIEVWRIS